MNTRPLLAGKKRISDNIRFEDRNVLEWTVFLPSGSRHFPDLVDNVHTFNHFPKYRVDSIQVVIVDKVDEELGTPGVRPGICHRDSAAVVPVTCPKLVLDRVTRAATTGTGRVATLYHESVHYAVEGYVIVKSFVHERLEIARRYGYSGIERNDDISHIS